METIWELKDVLTDKIPKSNKVLIVPHIMPDFDAIGSSMGLVNICKSFGKDSYILVNDNYSLFCNSIKKVFLDIKDTYNVINLGKYLEMSNNNDLLITTDVSNKKIIPIKDNLDIFDTKIVIDHHIEGENKIDTELKYINPKISSASEVVATLLRFYDMPYDKVCASLLHAGIKLDTDSFSKKTTADTHLITAELLRNGSDEEYVFDLFKLDFESDRKVHKLIENTVFINDEFAITCGKDTIYSREDLARAADYILKYGVNASFAIGLVSDNKVRISARSNGKVNVSEILSKFGGGGNSTSAATKLGNTSIEETVKKLKLVL